LDVLKLAKKYEKFYFVVHDFTGVGGDYNGESRWSKRLVPTCTSSDEYEIRMTVNGCDFGYKHPDIKWIHDGHYFDPRHGQVVFTKLKTIGSMSVYKADYVAGYVVPDPPSDPIEEVWRSMTQAKNAKRMTLLPSGDLVPTALLNQLYSVAMVGKTDLETLLYSEADVFLRTWNSTSVL
jgi:hypothetical protein